LKIESEKKAIDMPEQLQWEDGETLVLPDTTSKRAVRWANRLTHYCLLNCDNPELIERFIQAILDEERVELAMRIEKIIVEVT
jgi:hypothetical protein